MNPKNWKFAYCVSTSNKFLVSPIFSFRHEIRKLKLNFSSPKNYKHSFADWFPNNPRRQPLNLQPLLFDVNSEKIKEQPSSLKWTLIDTKPTFLYGHLACKRVLSINYANSEWTLRPFLFLVNYIVELKLDRIEKKWIPGGRYHGRQKPDSNPISRRGSLE